MLITVATTNCGINGTRQTSFDSTQSRALHVNQIAIYINSRGFLDDSYYGEGAWRSDPNSVYGNSMSPIVCEQGPWIIGKMNGVPAAGITYYRSSYMPGPMINGRPALQERPQDSPRYHPYALNGESKPSDRDYSSWPSDLGAPVAATGAPLLLGDAMVWSVFNGADTTAYPWDWPTGTLPHLPVEIRQTVYAHARPINEPSAFANTVFVEWMFINGGNAAIESCYVGLWTDIDFDDMESNFPAIDTSLQMGYCWDGPKSAGDYPAAVGYILLYGPAVPDASSSATFMGHPRPGYRNLPLSSFWGIIKDAGADTFFEAGPTTIAASWNVARGYDKTGQVILDSVAKVPTRFPYSGDPVTGSGWVYNGRYLIASEGFIMFSGPFNLAPGDTQWVMTALVGALDSNRIASVQALRNYAIDLHSTSYNGLAHPTALSVPGISLLRESFSLQQNFPNPFNPSTTISYSLATRSFVKLSVTDILGRVVAVLEDGTQEAGVHEVTFDAKHVSSGSYLLRLQTDSGVLTRKMMLIR